MSSWRVTQYSSFCFSRYFTRVQCIQWCINNNNAEIVLTWNTLWFRFFSGHCFSYTRTWWRCLIRIIIFQVGTKHNQGYLFLFGSAFYMQFILVCYLLEKGKNEKMERIKNQSFSIPPFSWFFLISIFLYLLFSKNIFSPFSIPPFSNNIFSVLFFSKK